MAVLDARVLVNNSYRSVQQRIIMSTVSLPQDRIQFWLRAWEQVSEALWNYITFKGLGANFCKEFLSYGSKNEGFDARCTCLYHSLFV